MATAGSAETPIWQQRLATLPWCERYTPKYKRKRCQGLRWNSLPLKALYQMNSKHEFDPTLLAKFQCKRTAQWKYKFLQSKHLADHRRAKTLYLCHDHVWSYRGMEEDRRLDRWVKANPDKWPRRPTSEASVPG